MRGGDRGAGALENRGWERYRREAGEKRAGSGSSKMAGCESEMQNATR